MQASWAQGSASLPLRTFCQGFAEQSVLDRILGMHTKVYEVTKSCHCVVITCASFMGAKPCHAVLSSFCQGRRADQSNLDRILGMHTKVYEVTKSCHCVVIALSSPVQISRLQNPATLLLRTFCQDRRVDQSVLERILGMHTKVYEVTKSCHCVVIVLSSPVQISWAQNPAMLCCHRFAKTAGLTNPSLIEYSECTRRCTKSPRVVIALSSPVQVS